MKKVLIVAIHGILTGRSSPTWPERLEIWAAERFVHASVLTDHYTAGPFPLWNCFVQNPRAAASIAQVVEEWLEASEHHVDVHFVAHSNGCDIVRRAAIELMDRGHQVQSILMVSGPVSDSVAGMGLASYLDEGVLDRLVVYAADKDAVLAPRPSWRKPWTFLSAMARWPYGNAGKVGLTDGDVWVQNAGPVIAADVNSATRFFPGWGHGDFFPGSNPGRSAGTFDLITRDLHLSKS